MPFRFIHTADIHLDSPLRSLALRHEGLSDLIGTATRTVFARIIDLCLTGSVDALLIAGDLYDGSQTSMKTARFLVGQFDRLHAAGIPAFVIRGNHDAESRITKELVFPPSVTVFGARADVVMLDRPRPVAIHGISFARPHAPDSLLDRFKAPVKGAINIGMLHSSLIGAAGHDPYAPCTVADLQATGFDYWALGHVHIRADYPGRCRVVMPGMPQGRDVGEAGAKSVTLVSIDDDGTQTVETRDTAVARFERLHVDVTGVADWRAVVDALTAGLQDARRSLPQDHLVLRPVLTGATPLAWRVLRDLDLLREQAVAVSDAIGSVWIDKIETACTHGDVAGPLGDLAQMIGAAAASPAVLAAAMTEVDALLKALPRDLRDLLGTTEADQSDAIAALMEQGADEVLARLSGAA
ncbi:MAG: DNA repair exonuclease [Pseudomonadota bacterium]